MINVNMNVHCPQTGDCAKAAGKIESKATKEMTYSIVPIPKRGFVCYRFSTEYPAGYKSLRRRIYGGTLVHIEIPRRKK